MTRLIIENATSSLPLATSSGILGIDQYVQFLTALIFGAAIIILLKIIFLTVLKTIKKLFLPPPA